MLARLPEQLPNRLPELPQFPASDEVRDTVATSWRSAINRLPKLDPDKLSDLSRGYDALKQLFARA